MQADGRNEEYAMRYAIVIEKATSNYAAYVPDLPGCIATGTSIEETEQLIHEGIMLHLEGLQADEWPIARPNSQVEYVEVSATWV
jgi:predicted RNase H-like HicB family nuclease